MNPGPIREGLHLAGRFVESAKPGAPSVEDARWASQQLLPGEQALWDQMSNPDKRHSVAVARAVSAELAACGTPEFTTSTLAAALLHDVGKVASRLRTPARVIATVVWIVVPDRFARRWLGSRAPLHRLAQYRLHPELGEELLVTAGSAEVTSQWAGDHHRPKDRWRVAPDLGQILKDCDDD